jgi:hypothetical protein
MFYVYTVQFKDYAISMIGCNSSGASRLGHEGLALHVAHIKDLLQTGQIVGTLCKGVWPLFSLIHYQSILVCVCC